MRFFVSGWGEELQNQILIKFVSSNITPGKHADSRATIPKHFVVTTVVSDLPGLGIELTFFGLEYVMMRVFTNEV